MTEIELHRRYFDAAHAILAEEGYGALKQARVCAHLGVTTGSFYHSFKNWEQFTVALLTDWHLQRTTVLIELAKQERDPVETMERLLASSLELQHSSEAAIRVWAGTDPYVASVQISVDEERYDYLHQAFKKLVGAKDASKYAWWGMNTLVGFEQVGYRQTAVDLNWQMRQLVDQALSVYEERRKNRRPRKA